MKTEVVEPAFTELLHHAGEERPKSEFEGGECGGEPSRGDLLAEKVDEVTADGRPLLAGLGLLGRLVLQIGDHDRRNLLRVDGKVRHADPFQGIDVGDQRNGVRPSLIDVVDALERQGTLQVDLHDDLRCGFDPFRGVIDGRRGNDLTRFGQAHRLDHRHVQGAEPAPFDLQGQLRPLAFEEGRFAAVDASPELLAANGADPSPDGPGLEKDVFELGAQGTGAHQVDPETAPCPDLLRQRSEGGLREAHHAPGGGHQHPVPEQPGRLRGGHDLGPRLGVPDTLVEVAHLTPPLSRCP